MVAFGHDASASRKPNLLVNNMYVFVLFTAAAVHLTWTSSRPSAVDPGSEEEQDAVAAEDEEVVEEEEVAEEVAEEVVEEVAEEVVEEVLAAQERSKK